MNQSKLNSHLDVYAIGYPTQTLFKFKRLLKVQLSFDWLIQWIYACQCPRRELKVTTHVDV